MLFLCLLSLRGFRALSGREETVFRNMHLKYFFLVPGLAHKELGSHHSILTSKKLNKLKNHRSLIHPGIEVIGQTAAPKSRERDRQVQ